MRRSASFSASDTLWIGYLYRIHRVVIPRVRVRGCARSGAHCYCLCICNWYCICKLLSVSVFLS
nr:MAG TPA: hypothetical protein [Caudoviricetes sp.]